MQTSTVPFISRSKEVNLISAIIIFVIPSLIFLELNVGGRLFASEILLLVALPFLLLSRGYILKGYWLRLIIGIGILWLFSQIITDVIRATPFVDYSRGWSKIAFLLANFSALYIIMRDNKKRQLIFILGLSTGFILQFIIMPSELALVNPWKFGLAAPVTLLLICISQLKLLQRITFMPETTILATAILNLYLGHRSLSVICTLTAFYVFRQRNTKIQRDGMSNVRSQNKLALGLLLIIATLASIQTYSYSAQSGWLGSDAKYKYEKQTSGVLGLLPGGRIEIFSSTKAIADSPIIGHGSWAKNRKYVDHLQKRLKFYGYNTVVNTSSDKIPAHSYLFGSWVESGIVGAFFWTLVLVIVAKVLVHAYSKPVPLNYIVIVVCFTMIWNILFSPLGSEGRFYVAFYLVLLISTLQYLKNQQNLEVNPVD